MGSSSFAVSVNTLALLLIITANQHHGQSTSPTQRPYSVLHRSPQKGPFAAPGPQAGAPASGGKPYLDNTPYSVRRRSLSGLG
ncbi:uncharacterized protein BDW47DRAFT_109093 [Aspergillus candidus]|uniref:Secreted protein n=1 Tax=Aspergillus candidus TaxID=41067 RepID=A0A2I2F6M5_ASPCN|nr:hypothetical protein BDW47DRAFT_109093 [Aspergillus candidus]PLB36295.1 hypothetical protein BDW47DRAFT_109093 [Aspergillus candidus]